MVARAGSISITTISIDQEVKRVDELHGEKSDTDTRTNSKKAVPVAMARGPHEYIPPHQKRLKTISA
jgi:hypothetical protein